MHVTIARNGQEALEKASTSAPLERGVSTELYSFLTGAFC
jgi:hypothetical protein